VIKKPGKEYTCALAQIQPERALDCIFAGRYGKKCKSVFPLARDPPLFDLLGLLYRFSCSKITQLFLSLECEVVAMSVSKKPMVLVILDGYGYREDSQDNAIFS
jgi:2,3-bisphosphoglycerate-independent phosphoglycerate mutase